MAHNEATALLFTDIYRDGHRWSLTLRQGASMGDVDALLTIAQSVQDERAVAHGFTFERATLQPATSVPTADNGSPPLAKTGLEGVTTNAPREGDEGGRILCNRIEVSGSRVEFYAANDALKYPVLNAPDWQLRKALGLSDEDPLPDLGGEWIIEWAASEKLNQRGNPYKDLVAIWKREDYEGVSATMTLEEARASYEVLRAAAVQFGIQAPVLPDTASVEAISVIGKELKEEYFAKKRELEAERQ